MGKSMQAQIEDVMRELPLLPGKECKVSEYAYRLSIAEDALDFEAPRIKNPQRQLKKIRDNAIGLYKDYKALPRELRGLFSLDAVDGLKKFIVGSNNAENLHGGRRRGNKSKPVSEYLTSEAKKAFRNLTGKRATVTGEQDRSRDSDFVVFSKKIFAIFYGSVPNRPTYYAKKVK